MTWDVQRKSLVEHEIRLTDETPFRQPHRRVPQGQLEEFRMAVQDLLQSGFIRESNSPFASPVVLVRKKRWRCKRQS